MVTNHDSISVPADSIESEECTQREVLFWLIIGRANTNGGNINCLLKPHFNRNHDQKFAAHSHSLISSVANETNRLDKPTVNVNRNVNLNKVAGNSTHKLSIIPVIGHI